MKAWTLSLALALALAVSAAFVLAAPSAFAAGEAGAHALSLSAAKKKAARRAPTSGYIACTELGCHPTPPGCRPEAGRYWDGLPTGFDIVVCPRRR